ncbi:polysaccharide biosynthesis tyrosine autokinase [Micromonospora sp. NBC_01796]|uniref:polysaccharide biosynthesis tyrosine autokinase n=1 Tax=Micromonospora sp. NBC_01796 TaxID=2975987 RepID=UPI002DD9EF18|nr:polysaccharide biosynthesis tyrosine autokinase [Micromonospora sp. NBC_01796]WSA84698.1 polysaccharide biosynthesis tyrosine autokinase [Micromonospora sp. NBC_01796]
MDLRTHLAVVRQRWWLVLATVMVGLGAAGLVTVRTEPLYTSSVTFFVTTQSQGVTDAYQGGLFLQQRVKSYADLLTSDRLAQSIVADGPVGLTADEVQARITARVEANTVLLRATVTDSDQARSLRLTESVASHFVSLVQRLETPPGAQEPPVKIETVSGPRVSADPVSPRPARNLAVGGVLGLLLGIALCVLRGLIDNTVRDGATLQQLTGSPLLGQIPWDVEALTAPLIVGTASHSSRAEAMRKLRTNLRFVDVHESARVIAVTSSVQGEGKTTLSCNLAISLAEAGWQVLLVDADLRRPKIAQYLGLEAGIGLTDVLIGEVEVADVVQPWGDKSLLVLPGGSMPPNPSELLGSKGMADLLRALRDSADIVIVDTAPLLAVTDAAVVAVQTDGVLLATRHGKTTRAQVATATEALEAVSARVLGCVLNMAKVARSDNYQYEMYRTLVADPPPAEPIPAAPAAEQVDWPVATGAGTAPAGGHEDELGPLREDPRTVGATPTQELSRIPR